MSRAWVLDASVLIQAYVREADSARVRTLLLSLKSPQPDQLHIPEFCLLECANILWKHVRFSGMSVFQARRSIDEMRALPLSVYPASRLLPRALMIGLDHQIAVYDSLYIALAEIMGHPLITADERQAKTATALGVTIKPLSDFPEYVD